MNMKKWTQPKPLREEVRLDSDCEQGQITPTEQDPAFSDFNLPLIEQDATGGLRLKDTRPSKTAIPLKGWSK